MCVLGQDRGEQLQSRLMLSQPHVVFSPSLSTAPEASKYLLYCTQAVRWWVGEGGRGEWIFQAHLQITDYLVTVFCSENEPKHEH